MRLIGTPLMAWIMVRKSPGFGMAFVKLACDRFEHWRRQRLLIWLFRRECLEHSRHGACHFSGIGSDRGRNVFHDAHADAVQLSDHGGSEE